VKLITLALASTAALALAGPANADAAYLSKERAKAKTSEVASHLYLNLDWATDWSVEPSYGCTRRATNVVDCEYAIYDEVEGIECWDVVRSRLAGGRVWTFFPRKADCH
jgi:hypothetical protein